MLISEFNFAAGGLVDGIWGKRRDYDFTRLQDAMSDGAWPDILVLCEGAWYRHNGGAGVFGAATAMREAGGRAYMPLPGTLTGDRGPLAPIVFVDLQTVIVHHWYSGIEPDRMRPRTNLLVASRAGSREQWRLIAAHWDVNDPAARMRDARNLRPYARPETPAIVVGDFNSHPSGPHWTVGNFEEAPAWRRYSKARWPPQRSEADLLVDECDTDALDFLLGRWSPELGSRRDGVGFHCVAELVGDTTPTVNPGGWGTFGPMVLDRFLVNQSWVPAVRDYQVHVPRDPANPPSDHRRITVDLDI